MLYALRVMRLEWCRVELWDDSVLQPGDGSGLTVRIRQRHALLGILRNPSLGFGDGFSAGSIEVEGGLVRFLERLYLSRMASINRVVPWLWDVLAGRRYGNSLGESRDNIQSHYDLGNDFYALWLDERMIYTCAYYREPSYTLSQAQVAKLDHVCRKLVLEPGQRVLELGCGWGALALHMAERYGVHVTAYNISHAQIAYAREKARAAGLDARVEFVEDDYRSARGDFDRVVSVGMLEHVGVENYTALGAVIDRCLSSSGLGLIHTIGRSAPRKMDPWIERSIFPGAHPPTLAEMMKIFSPYPLDVIDFENLRLHYAKTCEDWLERYDAQHAHIEQKFDAYFARAWRLYLAGSVAAFLSNSLDLFQVLFARTGNTNVPMTRDYMYR
jgi:cyclopropane-fatty-acyl-phospholipid synthase